MSPQSVYSGNLTSTAPPTNQPGNPTNNNGRRTSLVSLKSFTLMLPAVPETDDPDSTKADSATGLNLEINSLQSTNIAINTEEGPPHETADERGAQIGEVLSGEQKNDDVQTKDDTTLQVSDTDQPNKMAASMPIIDDQEIKPKKSFNSSTNVSKSMTHLDAFPGTTTINMFKKKHWNSWSSFMSIFNKRLPIITHSSHNLSYSTTATLEQNDNTTKSITDDQNDESV